MKAWLFKLFVFLNILSGFAQQTQLNFNLAVTAENNLVLDSTYTQAKDSFRIETFRFYITRIEFYNNKKLVWKEKNSFHLIDAAKKTSQTINLKTPANLNYDFIQFNLGVDSVTNVSGALGGDLDPTKGMYWTWQNGYINFKIEGKRNTEKENLKIHLGGYKNNFNEFKKIKL
jgi:hypothetical protein